MERRIFFIPAIVILSLIISGCVGAPPPEVKPTPTATLMVTPTPTATPGPYVIILKAPSSAEAGRSFEITWRVNSPVDKNINHTAVHYGPDPKSEPLTLQSYPNLTKPQSGLIPANFSTNLAINRTGLTYFRAHAIIDGINYWSEEKTVAVSLSPTIKILSLPLSVESDKNFTIQWEVLGGTPGSISHTAVHWGFSRGSANISDYPRVSIIQTGKTPQKFGVELKAPASGPIYLRVHAIVDGTNLYTPEYQITIILPPSGGGY